MLAAEDWREIRGHGYESGPISVEGGIGLVHDLVEGELGEGLAEAMVGEVSIAPDLVDDAEGGDAEVGPLAEDMSSIRVVSRGAPRVRDQVGQEEEGEGGVVPGREWPLVVRQLVPDEDDGVNGKKTLIDY